MRNRIDDYKARAFYFDAGKESEALEDAAEYKGVQENGEHVFERHFADAVIKGVGSTQCEAHCNLMENLFIAILPGDYIMYSQWWDHAKFCYRKEL